MGSRIRELDTSDMPAVLRIDHDGGWSNDEYSNFFAGGGRGTVYELDGKVVAFVLVKNNAYQRVGIAPEHSGKNFVQDIMRRLDSYGE